MAEKVSILFKLKDQASNGVKSLKKGFGDLTTKIKSVLTPANLLAAGIVALGVAAVKQFNKFAELETKMVNVGNLYGANRDEVNELTDELIELSTKVPTKSLDDLSSSLFDVVSAGVPASESVKFLGDASKLATAGVTDTSIAVDGLTSVMNAYQIEFSKANEVSDKFFAAQQKGKTTIAELSSNIGKVAPTAQAAGVGLDELLGVISALTLQGIKTSEATTQVKAALSNVIKPSEQAAELAGKLGLEFNSQALEAKGLSGFLKDVQEKTGGNINAMGKLFGSTEALNAVLAVSKNNFEALDEVQKAVTESAGATDKAYQQNLKTFAAQWQLLKNNIDALWSGLIRTLIPAVTATVKAFNSMFKGINTGTEKIKKGWSKFTGFFKKNTKDIQKIKTDAIKDETKKELDALEKKKKIEDKKLKAQLDARSDAVEKILSALGTEETAEETQKENLLSNYKLWLAEQEALRDVDHQDKINKLNEFLSLTETDSEEQKKIQAEIYNLKKQLREQEEKEKADALKAEKEAQEKLLKDLTSGWESFYGKIGDVTSVEAAFKQMGEGVKDFLRNQIIAWMATESAKATAAGLAAAIPTLGGSIVVAAGQVAGISAAGAAAITAINSVKFEKGGIVPGASFTGDKIPILANSGELILNKPQQQNLGQVLYNTANNPNIMSGNNSAIIRKLDSIEQAIKQPGEIRLNGSDFSRATYNKQKTMLRNGQISTRGRA